MNAASGFLLVLDLGPALGSKATPITTARRCVSPLPRPSTNPAIHTHSAPCAGTPLGRRAGVGRLPGARLGVAPQITGQEAPTALLSDTTRASTLFGYPLVPIGALLDWVADWVGAGRESFNKPTKFEVRDGGF